MSSNPYTSPEHSGPGRDLSPDPSEPFPFYVPIVQLCLRLLGVYVFLGGITDVIENCVAVFLVAAEMDPDWIFYDRYALGRIVGSGLYAGAGLYLIVSGRWLIETVFLPTRMLDTSDEPEIGDDESPPTTG
jgi:hypothetical protein